MPILPTTIGSYPKPDYLRIPEFKSKHPDPARRYSQYLTTRTEEDLEFLTKATRENVLHQVSAGIHITTAYRQDV